MSPLFPAPSSGDDGWRHAYGSHPDQFVEVWMPTGAVRGSLVLIHGGYWRASLTCALMLPLVPQFRAASWRVVNVEYRRGAHGWSATQADIHAALAWVRASHTQGDTVLLGHSVGGQLALLAAAAQETVVALAPVTDLVRSYDEQLGEHAVREYLGTSPAEAPQLYRDASPLAHVPPACRRVLLVHGVDDERVPLAHTRAYLEALRHAGGVAATLWELPSLPHRRAIDPQEPYWQALQAWLDGREQRVQAAS